MRFDTEVDATDRSCTGAELSGPTARERPNRAITLTTTAAFVTTVFARSIDVADASTQAAFRRLGRGDF
jgi:hypothetical protein